MADMAEKIWPIASLLKHEVKLVFPPAMEAMVWTLLEELSARLVLVYSNWDAAIDNFLCCGAGIDGVRATLKQKENDAFIFPVVFISIALPSSPHPAGPRSISRLAASSGASSASVGLCGVPRFAISRAKRPWKASIRLLSAPPNPEMARVSHTLPLYSGGCKDFTNGNADFLSWLSLPASKNHCSGRSRLTQSDDKSVYCIRWLPLA